MFRTKFFELVELIVPVGVVDPNSQVFFQQQPQLQSISGDRQIYIKGVEVFSNAALPFSPLTSGNPVAAPADLENTTITFVVDGTELLKRIPLTLMNRVYASAGTFVPFPPQLFMLKNNCQIAWTKTYVTLVQAPVTAVPYSYLFGVHYDFEPDEY